jgi:predicted transcriptional regulator
MTGGIHAAEIYKNNRSTFQAHYFSHACLMILLSLHEGEKPLPKIWDIADSVSLTVLPYVRRCVQDGIIARGSGGYHLTAYGREVTDRLIRFVAAVGMMNQAEILGGVLDEDEQREAAVGEELPDSITPIEVYEDNRGDVRFLIGNERVLLFLLFLRQGQRSAGAYQRIYGGAEAVKEQDLATLVNMGVVSERGDFYALTGAGRRVTELLAGLIQALARDCTTPPAPGFGTG